MSQQSFNNFAEEIFSHSSSIFGFTHSETDRKMGSNGKATTTGSGDTRTSYFAVGCTSESKEKCGNIP